MPYRHSLQGGPPVLQPMWAALQLLAVALLVPSQGGLLFPCGQGSASSATNWRRSATDKKTRTKRCLHASNLSVPWLGVVHDHDRTLRMTTIERCANPPAARSRVPR